MITLLMIIFIALTILFGYLSIKKNIHVFYGFMVVFFVLSIVTFVFDFNFFNFIIDESEKIIQIDEKNSEAESEIDKKFIQSFNGFDNPNYVERIFSWNYIIKEKLEKFNEDNKDNKDNKDVIKRKKKQMEVDKAKWFVYFGG